MNYPYLKHVYPYDLRNAYNPYLHQVQQYPYVYPTDYYEEELSFTPDFTDDAGRNSDDNEVFIFEMNQDHRRVKEKTLVTFNGEPQTKTGTCEKKVCAFGHCQKIKHPCIKTRNTKYEIYFVYGLAENYMSAENIRKFESCVHRAENKMSETVKTISIIATPAAAAGAAKLILAQGGVVLQTCVNNAGIPQNAYEFDVRYRKSYSKWR